MGGPLRVEEAGAERSLAVDGFSGRVHVEWDAEAAVTPLGQLAFFVAFVKQGVCLTRWWRTARWS